MKKICSVILCLLMTAGILHIGKKLFWGTTQDYLESEAGRVFSDPQRGDDA